MEELNNKAKLMAKNMPKEIIEIDTKNKEDKCSQLSEELMASLSATAKTMVLLSLN